MRHAQLQDKLSPSLAHTQYHLRLTADVLSPSSREEARAILAESSVICREHSEDKGTRAHC